MLWLFNIVNFILSPGILIRIQKTPESGYETLADTNLFNSDPDRIQIHILLRLKYFKRKL